MFRFMNYRVEYYASTKRSTGSDRWFWRVRSKVNGKIVADCGEGYHNRIDCENMIRELWGFMMYWQAKNLY